MKQRTPDTPIPMPVRGLDKTLGAGQQRKETCPDAQNVRSVDTNKRVRVAQRPGMVKAFDYAMDGPVRVVATLVFENKTTTYEATEDVLESNGDGRTKHTEIWKKKTESKKDVRNVAVAPLSGNVYALSGNIIEKRNGDGVLQWAYSVSVANKGFTLEAMALGPDEAIHVAVSSGTGGAKGAAIYRVRQAPVDLEGNTEPILEWTYKADGWVRELMMDGGELKALVQFDEKRRSYVWTFGNVSTAAPQLKAVYQVPFPSTCMAIAADGASYTGHPVFENRDTTPGKPGVGISLESWTPDDLDSASERIWAHWKAEELTAFFDHGDSVTVWPDSRGTGRDWGQGTAVESKVSPNPVPTLNVKSTLEKPTVLFDGVQGLFSPAGGGVFADRDSCLSAVPNHGDGAYCIFIVCRPATTGTLDETDQNGQPLDTRRWLFNQFHHTKYAGPNTDYFDTKNTKAYRSGIVVNSGSNPLATDDDLYCWGKSKSLRGSHEPGKARPFTSSSGYRFTGAHDSDGYDGGAWTAGTSAFDYPGMPLLRGAGGYGWPKEGEFADTSSTASGSEGWCVMTFMHCGGLSEYIEVSGSSVTNSFTLDEPLSEFYPNNAEGKIYIGGTGYPISKVNDTTLLYPFGFPSAGDYDGYIVWNRNHMTRSLWRISGVPYDRWEALPMAYKGPSTFSSPVPGDIVTDLNVEHQPTGLGLPMAHDFIRGFVGEIAEILVLGNRTGADSGVTLGGATHYPSPTVLTHPKYAANDHVNDTVTASDADHSWQTTGNNLLSTEMEKIEGYLMHRYGIQKKLQSSTASYPHPHYPGYVENKTHDLPLADGFASAGQAWPAKLRQEDAMIVKHDATGRMLWCLLSQNAYGPGTLGDIFTEDLNGVGSAPNVGFTDAPATNGIAVGLDGDVFVAGVGTGANDGEFAMGRIIDKPKTAEFPQLQSIGWWTQGTPLPSSGLTRATFQADVTLRCKCDEFGNFYVPFPPGASYIGFPAKDAIRAFTPEGKVMFRLTTLNHGSSSYQNGYALAFPPTSPDYNLND